MSLNDKYLQTLQHEWKEVTEEQWWEALECLPPMRWRNISNEWNAFCISEGYTSYLHDFYIKHNKSGKCYSALRSGFISDADLLNNILTQFNN